MASAVEAEAMATAKAKGTKREREARAPPMKVKDLIFSYMKAESSRLIGAFLG